MLKRRLPIKLVINYSLRLSLAYALFGVAYLLISNYILYNFTFDGNYSKLSIIHNFKGITFILVSALIFYLVIRNFEIKIKSYLAMLDKQNRQLKEYAFHTSHHLRRPVVNLMGLHNLINQRTHSYRDLKQMISTSLIELDAVVQETNQILKIDEE